MNMKILVVDDKTENLYLLERVLKKINYEVVVAENGKQALEKLHGDNFEMVISDILMPVMDGFQLCKAVRSDEKFNDLLFVFYTATYVEKEDEEFALKLGADKFLRKPLEPEKFIRIIKDIFLKKELSQTNRSKIIAKEEKELLKLYSERLVHKLEKKLLDLEKEIIERKRVEDALKKSEKQYCEAFRRAECYKDLFAHDINNILQNILIATQLCQVLSDNPEQQQIVAESREKIIQQVRRGANLTLNVRKLSQLEKNEINLERRNLLPILENIVGNFRKIDIDKELDIKIEFSDKNRNVLANEFLEDVFRNICENAITHNENPIVRIKIKISREQIENKRYIRTEFIDNGIGIEDSRKKEIFRRQYSKFSIGLGLSLVQRIIDTFNGKIWVEDRVPSDYKKGCKFIILIPEVM